MIVFQTSYPESGFNQAKGREEATQLWGDTVRDINEHEENGILYLRLYFTDGADVSQSDVNAFIANTDLSTPTAAQQEAQAQVEAVLYVDAQRSTLIGELTTIESQSNQIANSHPDVDVQTLAAHIAALSQYIRTLVDTR